MKHLSMAVVRKNGKVLVKQRYNQAKDRVFEFPGGAVKEYESATDAAARELFDETKIERVKHSATFSAVNDLGGRTYYAIFNADDQHEAHIEDVEQQHIFQWLTPNEIPLEAFYQADVDFIKRHLLQE
ncbi:DNA mismatch repair protein MutT [Vibrio galatheae]|uniref:DNA mismatch repair protein MutT n=1 Tax=Vibrio galatheae TaxID=579748 RepID=A0A0F4NLA4_9VIBR|nr:NUDIX hydrolase [Vibrio galatheae]KJY83950.1 DNA mismatch repair protein MutT [Vibrio galatheae]